uniref:Uncharacterized protein n=1 Tax=Tanacetum cinerariifolium TaxID=118510 RepID=A0A6L2K7A0_TANCI|nr:hypothetical protein [Tanacetum cinerariifolium]
MSNPHQELASPRANSSCKELASPKQTALRKDESNPLIVNSLLKTIWSSMHHVIAMKHWIFLRKRLLTAQDLVIKKLQKKVKRIERKIKARTLRMTLFKIGNFRRKSLDKENMKKMKLEADLESKVDTTAELTEEIILSGSLVSVSSKPMVSTTVDPLDVDGGVRLHQAVNASLKLLSIGPVGSGRDRVEPLTITVSSYPTSPSSYPWRPNTRLETFLPPPSNRFAAILLLVAPCTRLQKYQPWIFCGLVFLYVFAVDLVVVAVFVVIVVIHRTVVDYFGYFEVGVELLALMIRKLLLILLIWEGCHGTTLAAPVNVPRQSGVGAKA